MPSLDAQIAALGPWFHNLHLPDGTQTAPDHWLGDFPAFKWRQIAPHLPNTLKGWSVLDIGCNAGFYSLELARRGAQVMGIDVSKHYLQQARWAAAQCGLELQTCFRQGQVYDLAHETQTYDLVLFMGVFYHLRYPLLGLDIVSRRVARLMVFQTLTLPGDEIYEDTYDRSLNDRDALTQPGWPHMAFVEHRFNGDPTNWWLANRAAVEAMLRSSGMKISKHPGHEFFFCVPDPDNPSCVATWNTERAAFRDGAKTGEIAPMPTDTLPVTRTLTFRHCWVHASPGYTETVFHDGTHVTASPEDSEEYHAKARRYGYGDDINALSSEHEILHTFIAEAVGFGSSPTLWAVAHGQQGGVAPVWAQEEEETLILAFQVYLNENTLNTREEEALADSGGTGPQSPYPAGRGPAPVAALIPPTQMWYTFPAEISANTHLPGRMRVCLPHQFGLGHASEERRGRNNKGVRFCQFSP